MNNLQIRYGRLGLSVILGLIFTLIAIKTIYAEGPGDLDLTFNGTGIVTTPVGSGHDWGFDIAIQSDDKIVAGGYSQYDDSNFAFALVRYTITGSLDNTFGINNTGIVTTPIANYAIIQSVAIQTDSNIVVAGSSNYDILDEDFTVARYTTDGVLDSTFGNGGIITTPISGRDIPGTVLLQPDGKIVVAGKSGRDNGILTEYDFAIVRYTPTGTLDSTFKDTGIVTTSIGTGSDWGYGAVLQPDGKIIVVGSSESSVTGQDIAVVRYTSDGDPDPLFNNGAGFVTTTISTGEDVAFRVALQPDGKPVVVGYGDDHKYFVVARYSITGALDLTFNQTGVATMPVDSFQEGTGVALQQDGKIIVGGFVGDGSSNYDFATLRYRSDGSLDSTFNGTGIVTTPIGNNDQGISTIIQPDGKILTVGLSDGDFAVVRYLWREYVYLPLVLKD